MTIRNDAGISSDRRYRYWLTRGWGVPGERYVNFVCLNPSTADANVDDPTVRRLIAFAKRWHYDGLWLTNLYAFRATDPRDLRAEMMRTQGAAVGPENDRWLKDVATNAALVVAAWGGQADIEREWWVLKILKEVALHRLFCLGFTKGGAHPRHPLYMPNSASLRVML